MEARVGPQHDRPDRAGSAHAGDGLFDEPSCPPSGVGRSGPKPQVQDFAGLGPGGQQRVVAALAGVTERGSLLGVTVNLDDGGVHVDGQRAIAGAGTGRPRPTQSDISNAVELADMTEGERPQERAHRRRRHGPVRKDLRRRSRPEHVDVGDEVPAGGHRGHQGQQLAARSEPARPIAQVDRFICKGLELEVLGQRRGQHQPGVGHRVLVIECHRHTVKTVRNSHRKDALLERPDVDVRIHILPAQRASFADTRPTDSNQPQRIQAQP